MIRINSLSIDFQLPILMLIGPRGGIKFSFKDLIKILEAQRNQESTRWKSLNLKSVKTKMNEKINVLKLKGSRDLLLHLFLLGNIPSTLLSHGKMVLPCDFSVLVYYF